MAVPLHAYLAPVRDDERERAGSGGGPRLHFLLFATICKTGFPRANSTHRSRPCTFGVHVVHVHVPTPPADLFTDG